MRLQRECADDVSQIPEVNGDGVRYGMPGMNLQADFVTHSLMQVYNIDAPGLEDSITLNVSTSNFPALKSIQLTLLAYKQL